MMAYVTDSYRTSMSVAGLHIIYNFLVYKLGVQDGRKVVQGVPQKMPFNIPLKSYQYLAPTVPTRSTLSVEMFHV